MNRIATLCLALVILSLLILAGCEEPPRLPPEPRISFNALDYSIDPATFRDTIVLTINFEDGDGDLGLGESAAFTDPPYHPFNFVVNGDGDLVTYRAIQEATIPFDVFIRDEGQRNRLVEYGDSEDAPAIRINDQPNSRDYLFPVFVDFNRDTIRTDTAYIAQNPNFFNITIDFLLQQDDGSFEEFDFEANFGLSFDGRFPVLNNPDRAIEGTLTYRMVSAFRLQPALRNSNLKLRVQIKDRALNRSNTIETAVFSIPQ